MSQNRHLKKLPPPPTRRSSSTRRMARRVFRRLRVYVPVALLLVLGMLVLLPLSPPWLARKVESELRRQTGLPIEVGAVGVHVAESNAGVSGLRLAADDPAGEPFEIGEVRAELSYRRLIAGETPWLAEVRVADVSELRLEQQADGRIVARGPLSALIDAVRRLSPEPSSQEVRPDLWEALRHPTPMISLRGLRFAGVPFSDRLPPLTVTLNELEIARRSSASEPLTAHFTGVAIAGSAEPIRGTLRLLPLDRQAALRLDIAGIRVPLFIPGFGEIEAASREIEVLLSIDETTSGPLFVQADLQLSQFSLTESRLGGERWDEDKLSLRVTGLIDPARGVFEVQRVALLGEGIALDARGEITLAEGLPGSAQLQIRRLPPGVLRIGREQAALAGLAIEPVPGTTPTLALAMEASGPFGDPLNLTMKGAVEAAGWQISQPTWLLPLVLRDARGTIQSSPEAVSVDFSTLDVRLGRLEAAAKLSIPLALAEDARTTASLEISARGEPQELIETLRSLQIMPVALESLTMPLTLFARGELPLQRRRGAFLPWLPNVSHFFSTGDFSLSWGRGNVALRDLPTSLAMEPGSVVLDGGELRLQGIGVGYGDLALRGGFRIAPRDWSTLPLFGLADFEGQLYADGPVPEIVQLASRFADLPPLLGGAEGLLRATVSAQGRYWLPARRLDLNDYSVDASLADGRVVLPLPDAALAIDDFGFQLAAGPGGASIRSIEAKIQGGSELTAEVTAGRDAIAVDFAVDGPVALAETLFPYDLRDFEITGTAKAEGRATLTATKALPRGRDVLRQWAAAFAQPRDYGLGIAADAPLRIEASGLLKAGPGVSFTHRDLPNPVRDIRGEVAFDHNGLYFRGTRADIGSSKNLSVNGSLAFGHVKGYSELILDAEADYLDINEWMFGWGEQSYAERPRPSRMRRPWLPGHDPRRMFRLDLSAQVGETLFLKVPAQNAVANLRYEFWFGRPNTLELSRVQAELYGGRIEGEGNIGFPVDWREMADFDLIASVWDAQAQGFLRDISESGDIDFRGLFNTENAILRGKIGDFATWTGQGDFTIRRSNMIGSVTLRQLMGALNLWRGEIEPTTISGSVLVSELVARFPEVRAETEQVQLIGDGAVDFNGRLDFIVRAYLLANRLEGVPLLGRVSDLASRLGDRLVKYQVTGTLGDFEVRTVPLGMEDRDPVAPETLSAEEARESGRGVLGRGLRFAVKRE
ncbi:MAG: hypothetical protein RLY93_15440 [Sumerlaeia bacterium]